jgi:hypothetical protein
MRPSPRRLVVLIAFFVATPGLTQGVLKGGWHEDTRNGYKVKIPDKWESVPIGVDEKWIVAKYLGDRALTTKRSDMGYAEMKPQLRVIVFSDEARKFKPAEVKVDDKSDGRTIADLKNAEIPYKDYKDYIKRNGQDGGFHFSNEKEAKIAGLPCVQYEIKFEKLTVPRRVVAWVFRGDAADYAVEFEVLEDHWDKYGPIFTSALQSFKFIKRDAATVGATGGTTGSSRPEVGDSTKPEKRTAWKSLTAKERADRRKSTEESRFRKVKDTLPPGWTAQMTPYFLVVSHADQKFTDKVVENIAACRGWLDKTFGALNDEYVMRGVIRICANEDEARAYMKGSGDSWNPDSREIVAYKSSYGGTRLGFDRVYVGMLNQYLSDKDPLISMYSPMWINYGLDAAISAAVAEGKTLKLQPDEWEATMLREASKSAARPTARQLMEASMDKFFEGQGAMVYSARLVRYLHATKKDFLLNYLKAVVAAGEELNKLDKTDKKDATTEEEEEAQVKERREAAKKRAAELIQKVHAQACNWSEKEWQALETGFAASLK